MVRCGGHRRIGGSFSMVTTSRTVWHLLVNSLLLRDFLECLLLTILYYLMCMSHLLVVLRTRIIQAEKQCIIFLSLKGAQPLVLIRLFWEHRPKNSQVLWGTASCVQHWSLRFLPGCQVLHVQCRKMLLRNFSAIMPLSQRPRVRLPAFFPF